MKRVFHALVGFMLGVALMPLMPLMCAITFWRDYGKGEADA